jgi:hypothetical protein
MAIGSAWQSLTPTTVDSLPDAIAVFELGSLVRSVLYIGGDANEGLRASVARALADPRLRMHARCVRWELTTDPRARAAQLLAGYRATHDGAPPFAQPRSPSSIRTLLPAASDLRPPGGGAPQQAEVPNTFPHIRTVA